MEMTFWLPLITVAIALIIIIRKKKDNKYQLILVVNE